MLTISLYHGLKAGKDQRVGFFCGFVFWLTRHNRKDSSGVFIPGECGEGVPGGPERFGGVSPPGTLPG